VADVFVSYVSEDRAIAEKISRGLEGTGSSVWWDRHIGLAKANAPFLFFPPMAEAALLVADEHKTKSS